MTQSQDFLNRSVGVKIDRPLGSRHPQHGFIYPVNYGCLPGTLAPDGELCDAYVLASSSLLKRLPANALPSYIGWTMTTTS